MIFWLMTAPHRVALFTRDSWNVMDLLTGTMLGQQSLNFLYTAYLVLKFQQRLIYMPVLQQTAFVLLLMLFDLIIERCLLMIFQQTTGYWLFWLPALTTAVIWPWLSGLLYYYQIKLGVADVG